MRKRDAKSGIDFRFLGRQTLETNSFKFRDSKLMNTQQEDRRGYNNITPNFGGAPKNNNYLN